VIIRGICMAENSGDLVKQITKKAKILPGVIDKIKEWGALGYNVILTTGRKESTREFTEKQLHTLGIAYDHLIMGLGSGQRILINDNKPESDEEMAKSISVERNKGLKDINV